MPLAQTDRRVHEAHDVVGYAWKCAACSSMKTFSQVAVLRLALLEGQRQSRLPHPTPKWNCWPKKRRTPWQARLILAQTRDLQYSSSLLIVLVSLFTLATTMMDVGNANVLDTWFELCEANNTTSRETCEQEFV